LTKLLYRDEDKLKRELAVAIARAANQGEDYLIELTNQICICLQVGHSVLYHLFSSNLFHQHNVQSKICSCII
jgi:hypothetical protein